VSFMHVWVDPGGRVAGKAHELPVLADELLLYRTGCGSQPLAGATGVRAPLGAGTPPTSRCLVQGGTSARSTGAPLNFVSAACSAAPSLPEVLLESHRAMEHPDDVYLVVRPNVKTIR
jgi:hypothetical protein